LGAAPWVYACRRSQGVGVGGGERAYARGLGLDKLGLHGY